VASGGQPAYGEPSLSGAARNSLNGTLWNISRDHSGLMPVNFTTLPHFSVSSAISLKSAGESASTSPPRSASRAERDVYFLEGKRTLRDRRGRIDWARLFLCPGGMREFHDDTA
jgi:hypothetical protein